MGKGSRGKGKHKPQRHTPFRRGHGASERLAASTLFELLLGIYGSRKVLSARDFCVICHYLRECKAPGDQWAQHAKPPGDYSGSYKKFLDKRLPYGGPYYVATIPAHVRGQPQEKNREVPFRAVYNIISEEVRESSYIEDLLEGDGLDDPNCVMSLPSYQQNPMVAQALSETGRYPLPVALYADGVRYTPLSAGRVDYNDFSSPPITSGGGESLGGNSNVR
eukprot:4444483-Pyramimonas_sp.AAC.2